jgi:twitching motility protein PilU
VALKNALRQAPDVILVGEIRDRDTMSAAIAYAQSGHLPVPGHACTPTTATRHSTVSCRFYPVEVRATMLGDLASALKAVVSQRLLRTHCNGTRRAPAVEVMLNTKLVSELIEKGDFSGVKEAMEKSMAEGSQTFEADIGALDHAKAPYRQARKALPTPTRPPTCMWRLQNDFEQANKAQVAEDDPDDEPSFTEITLDVKH